MADILDYHLQHYLRKLLRQLPAEYQAQTKSLRLCNVSTNPRFDSVYLLASNNGKARFFGQATCKNPFVCPVCSAKMMEKYRAKIVGAIECLRKDYFGFMVSFSIPHVSFMGCRETMEILRNSWQYFRCRTLKRGHGHVFDEFTKATGFKHFVKVMEHTWGKANGWHPHFHCVFWVPKGKQFIASDWESRICDFWEKTAQRETRKYWERYKLHNFILDLDGSYDKILARMYRYKPYQRGVYFSRNVDGTLREVQSADYMTGWTADREVTGNFRKQATASDRGHMTPYQILEKAATDPAMEELYKEFIIAVTTKPVFHRVDFSQTGLSKMAEAWRKEHPQETVSLQKKSQAGTPTQWHIVAYFSAKDWYELSCLDRDAPVFSNILFLAGKYNYLLGDYLSSLGVEPLGKVTRDYDIVAELFKCG